jgi:hypothetical protein
MRKTITFTAHIHLPDDCKYFDDGTVVPALREAFGVMMARGLMDQSYNPAPHLPFEPTSDGSVSRYNDGNFDVSELTGFTGTVDNAIPIRIAITAIAG